MQLFLEKTILKLMDVLFSFGIRLSVSNKIQFCIIFIYPEILLFIKAIKSQFCLKGDSLRRKRTLETVVEVRPTQNQTVPLPALLSLPT